MDHAYHTLDLSHRAIPRTVGQYRAVAAVAVAGRNPHVTDVFPGRSAARYTLIP